MGLIQKGGFQDAQATTATESCQPPAESPESVNVEQLLLSHGLLSIETLARARLVCQESGEPIEAVVTRLGLASEAAVAHMFAQVSGLRLIAAAELPADPVDSLSLSAAFLRDMHMLPIAVNERGVTIALANPLNSFASEAMRFAFGRPVECVVALPSDIDAAIERLYGRSAHDDAAEGKIGRASCRERVSLNV